MIERMTSSDPRKVKRGKISIPFYEQELRTSIKHLEQDIIQRQDAVQFSEIPWASEIKESLETLVDSLFEHDYARTRMHSKVLDTVRALVRDSITEKKGMEKILFEFLNQTHAAEHMIGV